MLIHILLVCLLASTPQTLTRPQDTFQCIEFFAGKARLTSAQRLAGRCAVKLDIDYLGEDNRGQRVMDITTPEGLAFLGPKLINHDWFNLF